MKRSRPAKLSWSHPRPEQQPHRTTAQLAPPAELQASEPPDTHLRHQTSTPDANTKPPGATPVRTATTPLLPPPSGKEEAADRSPSHPQPVPPAMVIPHEL